MQNFELHQPTSLAEVLALLAEDDGAKLLAGGQTLVPTMKQGLAMPSALISLQRLPELQNIGITDDGAIKIGAMTCHADVAGNALVAEHLPGLAALAAGIGDRHVRNRGTLGGSIANCDPSADYPAALLALGATVITDQREIAADAFFLGLFTTALEETEIITGIRIPTGARFAYAKFSNPASRYAIVGVGVAKTDESVRVAVTGAGSDGVFRWEKAEEILKESFLPDAINSILPNVELLNNDIHATAEYRAALIRAMTKRAVATILSD